jgi:hypothetical protein
MAWLLAGWIGSRLGWKPVERSDEPSAGTSIACTSPGGPAHLRVSVVGDEVLRAAFHTDAATDGPAFVASQRGRDLEVKYRWEIPPLTAIVPARTRAEMLASELRSLRLDPYLRDALALMARIHAL